MVLRRIFGRRALARRRPGYRSRFGGLWIDADDGEERIERRVRCGELGAADAARLRSFRDQGFVVLEGAVPHERIDALNADLDRAWERGDPRLRLEHEGAYYDFRPERREERMKLLDVFAYYPSALELMFADPIVEFLRLLFEDDVLAFQSLSFDFGSEQPMHQDTAYVVISSPMELAASWIALEDIEPGSGELVYYADSHRIAESTFAGKYKSWRRARDGDEAHEKYLEGLHEKSRELGLELVRFLPKKGDALIWAADLVHGGGEVTRRDLTRRSLVTHYCPVRRDPYYFLSRRRMRRKVAFGDGCWYASRYYELDPRG